MSKLMLPPMFTNIHRHLVSNAPKVLALPTAFVPFFVQKKLLSELLAKVFAEAIEDDELAFLEDKWLKVAITDLQLIWYISFAEGQLIIAEQSEKVDVTFSGEANEFILIAGRKEDPDTLFFQRRLSIQGETELGLEIKNLLDNIDFDNLPPFVLKALDHFSSFIQKGLIAPEEKLASA